MARSDATERAGDEPTGDAETLAEGPRERAARLAVGSGHVPAISLGGDGADDDLRSGEVVGTLRIVRRLGSGGMGVVYLARDLELEREVAVKVHREVGSFERLQRDAVAMAQLAHPNVVTVHGVGCVDGRPYVAMEFIAGPTLTEWVEGEVRSWRQVLGLMLAVSDGLAAAHDAGFVHRDLKPSNPADAGDIELRFVTDATGAPALDGRWRYGADGPWREDWDAAWTRGTVPPELVQRFDNPFQLCARP